MQTPLPTLSLILTAPPSPTTNRNEMLNKNKLPSSSSMASTFPMDILFSEILPRLPPKSLCRFKCVCKLFKTLISSPKFIDQYYFSSPLLILFGKSNGRLYYSGLDSPETPFSLQLHTNPNAIVSIAGSCNGLLCFHTRLDGFIVLNPTTCYYRIIPRALRGGAFARSGFGFDDTTHDYKIVGHHRYFGALVYSFNRNDWTDVIVDNTVSEVFRKWGDKQNKIKSGSVVNKHLVHWFFLYSSWDKQHQRIACFDLCKERWGQDVPLPDYYDESEGEHIVSLLSLSCERDVLDLGVLDGCLCLLTMNPKQFTFDVWVMMEYGVKDSWVTLVSFPNAGVTRWLKMTPLDYAKGSKDEFLLRNCIDQETELFWYNINDNTWRMVEIDGVSDYSQACICEGSLQSIPGGRQFLKPL